MARISTTLLRERHAKWSWENEYSYFLLLLLLPPSERSSRTAATNQHIFSLVHGFWGKHSVTYKQTAAENIQDMISISSDDFDIVAKQFSFSRWCFQLVKKLKSCWELCRWLLRFPWICFVAQESFSWKKFPLRTFNWISSRAIPISMLSEYLILLCLEHTCEAHVTRAPPTPPSRVS